MVFASYVKKAQIDGGKFLIYSYDCPTKREKEGSEAANGLRS